MTPRPFAICSLSWFPNPMADGLIWVGVLETCDCCGEEYPMSWIIFTGRQFLCFSCYYPSHPPTK